MADTELCQKCGKLLTTDVIEACPKPSCTFKEPVNTSGKVSQLFVIEGTGFIIEPPKGTP